MGMRRGRGLFGQQVCSAVGATHPIGLDGAMARRAGVQDFAAAMRAEDKVLLNRSAAVWTGSHCHLSFRLPDIRSHWFWMGMVDVMQQVGSTHRVYLVSSGSRRGRFYICTEVSRLL